MKLKWVCKNCGKGFKAYKNHGEDAQFCSITCYVMAQSEHQKNMGYKWKGTKNGNWNGGECRTTQGRYFKRVVGHPHANSNGYILNHRLVLENHLIKTDPKSKYLEMRQGRLVLKKKYHVHHIDCDHDNDDPINLQPMTNSEHRALHNLIESINLIKFTLVSKETDAELIYKQYKLGG